MPNEVVSISYNYSMVGIQSIKTINKTPIKCWQVYPNILNEIVSMVVTM